MTAAAGKPILMCDVRELAERSLAEFAALCSARLDDGDRLVTLFGRVNRNSTTADIVVTAVLQSAAGDLSFLRAHATPGASYPSLTVRHPAAHIYERELWEQTGLQPDGHPWLKPVRFESERQQRMADYPFFQVRGQEVHEVGVGPIHAGVIEPGHFRFMCLGEKVHHLEIQLGYQHRGVEKLLLTRPPTTLTPIVESICGDSCIAYAWGHLAALEALTGVTPSFESEVLRGVALEMERIAIHLATLNGLATDIAFLQGTGTYGRLRTAVINACQRVCGNRFGRGWLRPWLTKGLGGGLRDDLRKTLTDFARDLAGINELMCSALSVKARFRGTGVVSKQAAHDLGLVGVAGRASGVAYDVRHQSPGSLYERFPIEMAIEPSGDCWARMVVRMREIDASLAWLFRVLDDDTLDLDGAEADPIALDARLRPDALCVSLIEGVRGPVVQVLETGAHGELLHYKVQDPSLPNWFGLALAVRDNGISDFPICNKSFDLSYCGNDL
ncbi:MAG: NADH-quinone oxidoreductase subunit C [Propionivibrio sp.]